MFIVFGSWDQSDDPIQICLHLLQDSELCSVEAKLALQQQIYVAACRLCQEEHLNKTVKKSRVQQCKREEQKLQDLQDAIFRLRLEHGQNTPRPGRVVVKREESSECKHIVSCFGCTVGLTACVYRSGDFGGQFVV